MQATKPPAAQKKPIVFDKLNRRTHLYAAMFFMPWFLVYGVSSVVFSHPTWFGSGPQQFIPQFEREYHAGPIPTDGNLRPLAEKMMKDNGFEGQFYATRNPEGNIQAQVVRFLGVTQLVYNPTTERLAVNKGVFRWSSLLTRIHARGGFERPGLLPNLWAVIVDAVQLAIMIWIASGVYMWWHLKRSRNWGLLAVCGGAATFAMFMLRL